MTQTPGQPDREPSQQRGLAFLLRLCNHPRFPHLVAGGAGVLLLAGSLGWWLLFEDDGLDPAEQLNAALTLIDDRENEESWNRARDIAKWLASVDYRDPDFEGAVQFILGISAFRTAEQQTGATRDQNFLIASHHLLEADRRALDAARKPEWAFALGTSLFHTGDSVRAKALLELARDTYPPGYVPATLSLMDIYVDSKSPDLLDRALELNAELLNHPDLTAGLTDRLHLMRAQIHLGGEHYQEAEHALNALSDEVAGSPATTVFRSRILIAEGNFYRAMALLEPIALEVGLNQTNPRQASYLMGICSESTGDSDGAVHYFERTAQKYAGSHEALASLIKAADLLRRAGRNEEALDNYREALQSVKHPEHYSNRWMSLDEFRQSVLDAWNEWVGANIYPEAIALTELMSPLFSKTQADELNALGYQRWAEHVDAELQRRPDHERQRREPERRERWRLSGDAYNRLAEELKTSGKYPEMLWTSAEHYAHGQDFANALRQLTRFIQTEPKQLMPLAICRRGRLLLELDRLDDAQQHFEQVISAYPTDPAAFEAQYWKGRCHLEQNDPGGAEAAWRGVLNSEHLSPAANEWQAALFSLGRLLYYQAINLEAQARNEQAGNDREAAQLLFAQAYRRSEEATRRIEEFLKRYPQHPDAIEARYLLAKSLQQSAQDPLRKLKTAETENARRELKNSVSRLLQQAIQQFRQLQSTLLPAVETDQLNALQRTILKDCYFEIAHSYYLLDQYERAITAYNAAANRYPLEPQVLSAYLQMANCYDALGKPVDARSMLEQARVILRQMPDRSFQIQSTSLSRDEWAEWIDWARRLHQTAQAEFATAP